MFAAVDEDLTKAVNIALKQIKNVRGCLEHAPGVRSDARNARGQAIRFRIILCLSRVHDLLRPGSQRNLFSRHQSLSDIANGSAAVPNARKIDLAVGQARRGTRGPRLTLAFGATLARSFGSVSRSRLSRWGLR